MKNFRFSLKSFIVAFLICIGFGVLAAADQDLGHAYFDYALRDAILAFYLIGSLIIIVHMWRSRGNQDNFWRVAHRGQLGVVPVRWRRWLLGESSRE